MFFKEQIKIFCIGRNKTGTTSLEKALSDFGYKIANQANAEMLLKNYLKNDWKPIIDFCKKEEVFQDVPFSCPNTWKILFEHFPKAIFILTTRDAEKWYQSLINFQTKRFSSTENLPSIDDLKNATYRYPGFMWDENRAAWNTPENDIYNKEMIIKQYLHHNHTVKQFFSQNQNFLEIDVSEKDAYHKLCTFLNKKPLYNSFPHLNKS